MNRVATEGGGGGGATGERKGVRAEAEAATGGAEIIGGAKRVFRWTRRGSYRTRLVAEPGRCPICASEAPIPVLLLDFFKKYIYFISFKIIVVVYF
jgi:hypothetical protein